jgi:hypothetical protein
MEVSHTAMALGDSMASDVASQALKAEVRARVGIGNGGLAKR